MFIKKLNIFFQKVKNGKRKTKIKELNALDQKKRTERIFKKIITIL
jgi:hypothetical protein